MYFSDITGHRITKMSDVRRAIAAESPKVTAGE
jgi:hypothetical protein